MRLKIRLIILYSCVSIAVLAIVGSVLFVQVRNNRSADLEQELTNQLIHLDFALTNLIEEAKSDVLQLSENELVRTRDDQDFTSFLNVTDPSTFEYNYGTTEQSIIDILNVYRTTRTYVNSVYMGRENGTFVRSHPWNMVIQYDPRIRPWYILGQENPGQVVVTEPYSSITTTDVNLGVEKALVGDDGEVYGVVGADITLVNLTNYISNFNVGYQGHMLLTDENGTIVAFDDPELLFENVEALLGNVSTADMMNQSQGVMTVETESGSSYLYMYTSPSLGWKLAVLVPAHVVNGVIQGPVFIALFGLFIALALLSLLTFFGLNISVINPLKRLSEVAADITNSGDLSRKTGITSKNEIGTLAASFDRMTDALREKEKGLRESEEKYREVVERANDGIIIIQDGIIQYSNQRVSDIAGFEAREIIGTSMTNYIHPDELPKVLDRYKRRIAGEHVPSIYETALVNKDGHKIDVELNAGIIKYQEKPADMVIVRDITERKQAEEKLSREEQRFRTIAEQSSDIIVIVNPEGVVTYVNQAAERILDLKNEERIGAPIFERVHPDDLKLGADIFKTLSANINAPVQLSEFRIRHRDGSWHTFETIASNLVKDNVVEAVIINLRDITERKRAEEALRKSEERLREAQRMALIGNWELDLVTNVLTWSDEIYRIFGIDPARFGASYEAFLNAIHPDDRDAVNQAYTSSLKTRSSYEIDHRLLMPDGNVKYVHEHCETYYDANGRALRSVGTVQDITERKKAEKESLFKGMLLDAAADSILVHDLSGRIVYANKAAEELRGYTGRELIGKDVHHIATQEYAQLINERIVEIQQKGEITFESAHYRHDDSSFPIEVHARLIDVNGEKLILRIGRDITERNKAEHQIRERMKELRAFFSLAEITERENITLEGLYQEIANILPQSWQYPEITCCRIVIGDGEFRTKNFTESPWMQSAPVKVHGSVEGMVEVGYLEERPEENEGPFMKEERLLINTIAERIGRITERKRTEEALQESEVKYRFLTEKMNDVVWTLDPDLNTTYVSPSVTNMLGYTQDERMKQSVTEQLTTESLNTITQALAVELERDGKDGVDPDRKLTVEMECYHKNGSTIWMEAIVSAIRDKKGKIIGIHGVSRDITAKKAAQAALKASEEKLQAMFKSMTDSVLVSDSNINIVDANDSTLRILGLRTKEELIGRNVLDVVKFKDQETVVANLLRMAKERLTKVHGEYCALLPDGKELEVDVITSAMYDDAGGQVGFINVIRDITERKQAEKDLLLYKDHLEELVKERTAQLDTAKLTAEQANKAKSDFLANMSHEIRTPLSTIIGFSELLYDETKGPLNDDQKKYLGYVTSSGQHLLSLINDILDLSKVEAGKMELLPTRFSISDLLKNSLSFVAEKALKHNIRLQSKISADVDMIEADERKVKQIIYNLLSNAVKFTPDGGAVTISADIVSPNSAALPVKIRKELSDTKYVLVSVKDTGIGIDKKDQTKIFTEFQQIEEPYSKKYEGTGLGLALSRKLVTLHGGKIWFESKGKDKGCIFYFTLPLKTLPKD